MENPTLKSYINISFPRIVFQLKSSHREAEVTAQGWLLTTGIAVRSAVKGTGASKRPQPTPGPPRG